jgi:CxxC motif-containing protein (DUF1111 family)
MMLPDLTVAERQAFMLGMRAFNRVYTVADGLGPVFNDDSCAPCHPAGGASNRLVTRFGRVTTEGFDPLEDLGGSLVQERGIGPITTADGTHDFGGEIVPAEANVVARRKSQSLLGLGFVDAVPDETWRSIAEQEAQADPSTGGRVQLVFDPITGGTRVGKFGWKAQVPTLRAFSSDAMLNEMGITSPGFCDEVCPQGDCLALGFNPTPALNDDGRDASAMTDFVTMLAPPLRGAVSEDAVAGEMLFEQIGCASCHRPTIQTGPSAIRALDRAVFRPCSDFLLHAMGNLGDGIAQGIASGREMRTAPLWSLRMLNRYLHDGSAQTLNEAIRRHDGQGRASRERFSALSEPERTALLAFLGSL